MPRTRPSLHAEFGGSVFGFGSGADRGLRTYAWAARQAQGRLVQGRRQAGGVHHLRSQLRREGLTPVSVRPVPAARGPAIRPRDVVLFTRQLATLLRAGIALLQALQIVRDGLAHVALAELIDQLRQDLEAGLPLSAALRRHPKVFPGNYAHLVEAAEASGELDTLFERLASDLEKSQALQSRVRTALAYPAVVLSVALGVLVFLMVAVVPTFESVYAAFGSALPESTRLVLALSRGLLLAGPWLLLLGAIAGLWLSWRWRQSETLRRAAERLLLRLPLLGAVLHQAALARWSRTLSGLLRAGLPLVEAMAAARGAAGTFAHADACRQVREELARGSSLRAALAGSGLFPVMVLQMCGVGEESGALAAMLGKLAEFYEREVDEQVARLSSVLEPALIVLLGGVVGVLLVALYLPIFQMGQVT